jgi:hypothetical protein
MINTSNSGYLYMKYYLHILLPLMHLFFFSFSFFYIKRITYDLSVIISNGEQRDVEFIIAFIYFSRYFQRLFGLPHKMLLNR